MKHRYSGPGDSFYSNSECLFHGLRQENYFQACPDAVLYELIRPAQFRHYLAGQLLLKQQQLTHNLMIILEGIVQVGWLQQDGQHMIKYYAGKGSMLNAVPILDGQGVEHDFIAFSPIKMALIPCDHVLSLLAESPVLAHAMVSLLSSRTRYLFQELRYESIAPLQSRLAHKLHELGRLHGQPSPDGLKICLKLSQEHLASLVGVARQTLNRELKNLSDHGMIKMNYSQIIIVDPDQLLRLSQSHQTPVFHA